MTGWLVYNAEAPFPVPGVLHEPFEPFDDMKLVPWDSQAILGEPDQLVTLNVIMDNLGDGAN